MKVSPEMLLRRLTGLALPPLKPLRCVGVDEWAFRRGYRYGTILVDSERYRVVDLLPDRQVEALAAWLRQHPGIILISRDRASAYADGARQGAPQAVQVADRWHLLKNLREAVERVLSRHPRALCQAAMSGEETAKQKDNTGAEISPPATTPSLVPVNRASRHNVNAGNSACTSIRR